MLQARALVELNSQWVLGNGTVSFWWDNWTGKGPLAWSYPVLDLDVQVVEYWTLGAWDSGKLKRCLPEEAVCRILRSDVRLDEGCDDILFWKKSPSGLYHVGATAKMLTGKGSLWVFKQIWKKGIPVKMSFVLWRVILGKMPVAEALWKFQVHGPSRCFCCSHKQVETLEHVFAFGCFAREVWDIFELPLGFSSANRQFRNICVTWWTQSSTYPVIAWAL